LFELYGYVRSFSLNSRASEWSASDRMLRYKSHFIARCTRPIVQSVV